MKLPPAAEVFAAFLPLDYTLYLWHVLPHRLPFLWRFHRVHHADLDLTASTALRFHFAEMMLSVPWRAAQVVLIGAAPLSLAVWQTATLVAILFHHSTTEFPARVERRLRRLVMTPRMHGIHHSIVKRETDGGWKSTGDRSSSTLDREPTISDRNTSSATLWTAASAIIVDYPKYLRRKNLSPRVPCHGR